MWILEYLGYRRHADHVLVPQFMGRCILNAINRAALPVETPTPNTRLVIAVHQYGVKQDLAAVARECAERGLVYLEDSPFGLEASEAPAPGALAKLLGFSKVLPAIKGGFLMSSDARLLDYVKGRRSISSPWSWVVCGAMALVRHRRSSPRASVMAEVAYELYGPAGGDNRVLRSNVLRALRQAPTYEAVVGRRLTLVADQLCQQIVRPDTTRLAYVVPLLAGEVPENREAIAAVFRRYGCDETTYHFDGNRNLFHPMVQPVFLIPLNPTIPQPIFESLVEELACVGTATVTEGDQRCSFAFSSAVM